MARIKVRHRASGTLGTIDENEFDPVSYEALSETKKDPIFTAAKVLKALPAIGGAIMGSVAGGPLGAAAGAGLGQLGATLLGRLTGRVDPSAAHGGDPGYGKDIADALGIAGTTAQYGGAAYGLQKAAPMLQRLVSNVKGTTGKLPGGIGGKLPPILRSGGAGERIGTQLKGGAAIPKPELEAIFQSPQAQNIMFGGEYATLPAQQPTLLKDLLKQLKAAQSIMRPEILEKGGEVLNTPFVSPTSLHELGRAIGPTNPGAKYLINRLLESYMPGLRPEFAAYSAGAGIPSRAEFLGEMVRTLPRVAAYGAGGYALGRGIGAVEGLGGEGG